MQALHRVAKSCGKTLDVAWIAHHGDAVAHLQFQVGIGKEVETGTVYARCVEVVAVVQTERAERASVVVAFCHEYASRNHIALRLCLPFHVDYRTDYHLECRLVLY